MRKDIDASHTLYGGLFLITLSTLMLQILLTRIFSVTMRYHFAFMAVSVAMFGLALGAVVVYLAPQRFRPERTRVHLAASALLFSVAIVISFLGHLYLPYLFATGSSAPAQALPRASWGATLGYFALTYIVISLPFVCSGVAVCLALTRFPARIGKLYAADLAGAAAGCVLLVYLLELTDAPTAIFVVAGLAAGGGLLFALDAGERRLAGLAAAGVAALLGFATWHTVLARKGTPLVRAFWVKGRFEPRPLFERWNAFSYFNVNPRRSNAPFGWGFGAGYQPVNRVPELGVAIDAFAGTVMTRFDGRLGPLEYLQHDVTNFAHHLGESGSVLVVGVGGGRDVLSALVFGHRSVVGVEINDDLVEALNGRFGAFTGHLDRDPRVRFVADEARSYVSRQRDRFDIIQVSVIDTWAATSAGAFVLSENSLYTVEAWHEFLESLSDAGLLSISRWYSPDHPAEMYRLTALAGAVLLERGVATPRRHVLLVTNLGATRRRVGMGTLIVSRSPLSDRDVRMARETAARLGFELLVDPEKHQDPVFAELLSGRDVGEYATAFPLDISPPTDDRPFFFNMLRLRDVLRRDLVKTPINSFNLRAVSTLGALLAIVVVLTTACLLVPVGVATGRASLRGGLPFLFFFAAIGFGFMLVEISQMQRLIVFLGHPVYGLSVALFALLLASGIGSYVTPRVETPAHARAERWRLAALLVVLVLFGALTPALIAAFRDVSTPLRIVLAASMLFSIGLFMGMAFPLGMSLASARSASLTPWLWGINGATSVCASVVAVVIALGVGISAAYWSGVAFYLLALVAFVVAGRTPGAPSTLRDLRMHLGGSDST